MYEDDKSILSLFINYVDIINTSVQSFLSYNCIEVFAETKSSVNKCHIYVHVALLLIFSLRTIVICQKYFRITVKVYQFLLFAPSLLMRRYTLVWCIMKGYSIVYTTNCVSD